MRFNDIHVHLYEKQTSSARELLKNMDKLGVEKVALLSWYGDDLRKQRENIERMASLVAVCPDRLYGMAWIEPRIKTPLDMLDWAVEKKGCRGFKMIPNHWYPYEERILRYGERMAQLDVPCLFHSGILYFKTFSSRFCRPVYYEDLLTIKNFRFALAHVSWPWTDECLALFGEFRCMRAQGCASAEMFIDLTPGTPPNYRRQVVERLITFGAEDFMLYGTDANFDGIMDSARIKRGDSSLFRQLKLGKNTIEKIARKNFDRFFKV
ncbi:MAG: amidohydrolase family protein [Verrucomicrobiae bacterium]|nr:amidohydrolase family protein [Verrucomicrobiae bacterium]